MAGRHVRVVPAETRRLGDPGIAQGATVRRYLGRAFLHGSILQGGNVHAVPVDGNVGSGGFVNHVDVDLLALADPYYISGNAAVECGGVNDFARSDFETDWRDADGVVGGRLRLSRKCQ